jgi:hypothetical protein
MNINYITRSGESLEKLKEGMDKLLEFYNLKRTSNIYASFNLMDRIEVHPVRGEKISEICKKGLDSPALLEGFEDDPYRMHFKIEKTKYTIHRDPNENL